MALVFLSKTGIGITSFLFYQCFFSQIVIAVCPTNIAYIKSLLLHQAYTFLTKDQNVTQLHTLSIHQSTLDTNLLPFLPRFVLTKVQSSGTKYDELTRRRTNGALSAVITGHYGKEEGTSARGAREAMTEG